jgi:hypothetical protein
MIKLTVAMAPVVEMTRSCVYKEEPAFRPGPCKSQLAHVDSGPWLPTDLPLMIEVNKTVTPGTAV